MLTRSFAFCIMMQEQGRNGLMMAKTGFVGAEKENIKWRTF